MTSPLCMLVRIFWRGKYFSRIFLRAPYINENLVFHLQYTSYVILVDSYRFIRLLKLYSCFWIGWNLLGDRLVRDEPFLSSPVHEFNILQPIILHYPEGECSEPVVVVAIKNQGHVFAETYISQYLLQLFLAYYIPCNRVIHIFSPVYQNGAWYMTCHVVCLRVVIYFCYPDSWVFQMLLNPVNLNQNLWSGIFNL